MADLVSYLVFDVEAVADGALIAQAKFGDEELPPEEAIARFGAERLEQYGSDVLPPTWMLPISVAVAKVDSGFRLIGLEVLDAPAYRPYVITDLFWKGWKHYSQPTLVTFNAAVPSSCPSAVAVMVTISVPSLTMSSSTRTIPPEAMPPRW